MIPTAKPPPPFYEFFGVPREALMAPNAPSVLKYNGDGGVTEGSQSAWRFYSGDGEGMPRWQGLNGNGSSFWGPTYSGWAT